MRYCILSLTQFPERYPSQNSRFGASDKREPKRLKTLEFQTQYRILKTSWGIAIDISGTLKESLAGKNVLTISEKGVTPEEKEQLIQGLESVLTQMTVDSKKYNIDIQKIWFNPCDFQTDALF